MKKSITIALLCLGIIAVGRVLMFVNTLLATGMIWVHFMIVGKKVALRYTR